jgi:hypothetical protein
MQAHGVWSAQLWARVVALVVLATFALGLQGASAATGVLPRVTITSHPANPTNSGAASFSFTSSISGSVFQCALDGSAPSKCSSGVSYAVNSGPHLFTVAAAKSGSNRYGQPTLYQWTTLGAGEGDISPWALQVENGNSNFVPVPPDQALIAAQRFNYIIAHPIAYAGEVAAMKAINPHLQILAYLSGTFAQFTDGSTYDPSWYLYDAKGHKVVNTQNGNFLMNPTIPGWAQQREMTCEAFVAQSGGFDGCYLDTLGIAPVSPPYVSAAPINPNTNKPWTQQAWLQATAALAGTIDQHEVTNGLVVMGNGLNNGPHFFSKSAPTKPLVDAMSGGIAEAWIRGANAPVTQHLPAATWLSNVNMIGATQAEGKPLLTSLKLWAAATPAQLDGWEQYSLASFLLETDGQSAFFFSSGKNLDRTADYPIYHLPIGAPTGNYTVANGVYQRNFLYGRALVNTSTSQQNVSLGGTFYDENGQAMTQINLAPSAGAVLTSLPFPQTTISSGPAGSTTSTSATFNFSSPASGATFNCTLDGGAPAPCTSPASYTSLAEGAHVFTVDASTSATGFGPEAAQSWTVDITPPTTTLLSAPSGTTTSTTATLSFSSSTPASTFMCSLDGATAAPCTNPPLPPALNSPCCGWTMTYANLAPGSHSVDVYAVDAYGLVGPPANASWTVSP